VLLPLAPIAELTFPFHSINTYGLFAVMTTTRREIIVEGSDDGVEWKAYEFRDKPGDLTRRPPFVAPHQPRLDWQMWFAAIGSYESEAWFERFCVKLLDGSPPVLALLAKNPFPDRPPKYIRAEFFRYEFGQKQWWTSERLGRYSPVLSKRE
jgi:lipase maturation factor 1